MPPDAQLPNMIQMLFINFTKAILQVKEGISKSKNNRKWEFRLLLQTSR
jgi:hypothetical protein